MPRFLLFLFLTLAACAGGWWVRGFSPVMALVREIPGTPAAIPSGGVTRDSALARRAAGLLSRESASLDEIRVLLASGKLSEASRRSLGQRWARLDPAGMCKWLCGLPPVGPQTNPLVRNLAGVLIDEWFATAPEAATGAWLAATGAVQYASQKCVINLLLGDDEPLPTLLLPCLKKISDNPWWDFQGRGAATTTRLASLPEVPGRTKLLTAAVEAWVREGGRPAFDWTLTQPEPLRSRLLDTLVPAALTNADSDKAAALSTNLPWLTNWMQKEATTAQRRRYGEKYAAALATQDPAAALTWAQENIAGEPLTRSVGKVFEAISAKDPATARAIVEVLPPGAAKRRFSGKNRATV